MLVSETAVSREFMNLSSAGVFNPVLMDLGPGKLPEPFFSHLFAILVLKRCPFGNVCKI